MPTATVLRKTERNTKYDVDVEESKTCLFLCVFLRQIETWRPEDQGSVGGQNEWSREEAFKRRDGVWMEESQGRTGGGGGSLFNGQQVVCKQTHSQRLMGNRGEIKIKAR